MWHVIHPQSRVGISFLCLYERICFNTAVLPFHDRKDHAKCEFAVHDVFAVDILISTGEGKTKEKDTRTTVYKRTDNTYSLKMKASRGEDNKETVYQISPFCCGSNFP